MRIQKKLIGIGNGSVGIIIPRQILRGLKFDIGDFIELELSQKKEERGDKENEREKEDRSGR